REFEEVINKCVSHSNSQRPSLRDCTRLQYMKGISLISGPLWLGTECSGASRPISFAKETGFHPLSFVGDFVEFDIVDGFFSLHTTSLGSPCDIINNVGNPNNRSHLYSVTGTEPVCSIACPVLRSCYCDQQIHFALNPGEQKVTFMSNIASTTVVMMSTTLPISHTPRSTVTSVVWVTGG
ncbi:uncharacterized protein ASPGLDRAFT_138858, partial [Aspergillus glaucus CBS 516.65]